MAARPFHPLSGRNTRERVDSAARRASTASRRQHGTNKPATSAAKTPERFEKAAARRTCVMRVTRRRARSSGLIDT